MRVDVSPQPLGELTRLLRVARAYEALDAAMAASEAGDLEMALGRTTLAHRLAPEDAQVAFWHAMVLFASGRPDEARPVLEDSLRSEPRLREFGLRFADANHGGSLASALGYLRDAPPPSSRANGGQPPRSG